MWACVCLGGFSIEKELTVNKLRGVASKWGRVRELLVSHSSIVCVREHTCMYVEVRGQQWPSFLGHPLHCLRQNLPVSLPAVHWFA